MHKEARKRTLMTENLMMFVPGEVKLQLNRPELAYSTSAFVTKMLYFTDLARMSLNHRVGYCVIYITTTNYENDAKTCHPGIAGCNGSHPDGKGSFIHQRDAEEGPAKG